METGSLETARLYIQFQHKLGQINGEAFPPGENFAIAVKNDGTLWGAGGNEYHQTGNPNPNNVCYFYKVGTDTDWAYVSAGDNFSLGVKTDSTLWAWGYGYPAVPTELSAGDKWIDVSAGGNHSLGIKVNGTLWAWGANDKGQLGTNSPDGKVGTDSDWQAVSAGRFRFSLGLKRDGSLWA